MRGRQQDRGSYQQQLAERGREGGREGGRERGRDKSLIIKWMMYVSILTIYEDINL